MFEDRKTYKLLDRQYDEAMAHGLADLRDRVRADIANLVAGSEAIVCDDPAVVTGPAGVEGGEWDVTSWGWLVLTNKRLNFQRLDGDGVTMRVAFVDDLSHDAAAGPFDTYRWQDRAQLRLISFGFRKGSRTRTELATRSAGGGR